MARGTRPNFLFIIADQLRSDHLGCYGNRVVRTPNIDAIAARGFAADRFYVACPICMPNRATLMTGRMPSLHGVRHNGIPLSLSATNFVELLRRAGYRTSLVGKSHLQNMTGNPPVWPRDPEERLALEARPDDGRYDQEWKPNWRARPDYDVSLPFYGFDRVHLTIEHGDDLEGHYRRWLRQQVPNADSLVGTENALPTPELALAAFRQAWRTRLPEALHPTGYCATMSEAVLEDAARGDAPFFLMCSFADPHHPFTPPGRYWDMYRPQDMELPRSYRAGADRAPPHVAALRAERDAGRAVKHTPQLFACTEQEAREAIALNYGSISFIDAAVGRLLARLEALGLAENTVVIFTADHGDFMGDHQLLLKGPIHYRGIVEAPFLWHDPQKPQNRRSDALCGTLDLAPTILARASVAPFNGIQGRDLAPLFSGAARTHHADLLIEEEGQRPQVGFDSRVRMRSLITDRHRLSVYDGVPWGEIYDLANDPDELVNLWDDPASAGVRADLVIRLARKMIALTDTSPYPTATA
ncbi:MAG TPA: sulfatase-like hydrolase/transferase [Stellaceae bacterium]|nr:sulfatase-like hydrolase/transferase [Stellaceae bacterium]